MQRPLLSLAWLLSGATLVAQGNLYTAAGSAPSDNCGSAVASAGDFNGDCVPDFIVGSPGNDANGIDSGQARVFSGADGSVLATWSGSSLGDSFGASVASAGDVNGDGFADVVVGAPDDDTAANGAGAAFVFSGRDGSLIHKFVGTSVGDSFGSAVGAAGHVDLDGYADVIVGARGSDYAQVFSGASGNSLLLINGFPASSFAGTAVAGIGDVDGDQRADVIVGVPGDDGNGTDAGMAVLISGANGATIRTVVGDSAGDALGSSVSSAGDFNNDGGADFVVGAPGDDNNGANSGSARVFDGSGTVLGTFDGDFAGDAFGAAVGAGDLNADGYTDIIVGAPGNDWGGPDAGATRALSGADGAILGTWRGTATADRFGASVATSGDTNRDGYADVLVGSPGDDAYGTNAGSATVFAREPFDSLVRTTVLTPAGSPALFGAGNEFVGDINNDGVGDFAIGAVSENNNSGTVRIISGADQSIIRTLQGGAPDIFFGPAIGRPGDVDQDGHDDILTGAQHWTVNTLFEGRATLWSGKDGSVLQQWFGNFNNDHMGNALGGLGDIDGDNTPDVYVGLLKANSGGGAVHTYSGATGQLIWARTSQQGGAWFGKSGEGMGDVNGDGVNDLVVGATQPNTSPSALAGYAVILSGTNGDVIHRWSGLSFGDAFGYSCASAGDVDGDGVSDAIVGARNHDPQGKISAGMARVFSGRTGALLYHFDGENAGDSLGEVVNGAGDVNGDGFDDFLIGAPGADPNGIIAGGRTYLYSGFDGALLQVFDGTFILGQLGGGMSGIGDVNGDGYEDINISATGDPTAGAQSGAAYVFETRTKSDPGKVAIFGAPCATSYGRLPLISVTGRPAIGKTFSVNLNPMIQDASPVGVLRISGGPPTPDTPVLPFLEVVPGCWIYSPAATGIRITPSNRGVSVPQSLPNVPALVGLELKYQFMLQNLRLNRVGLVLSNAAKVNIGQ